MPNVIFRHEDGTAVEVAVTAGENLLEAVPVFYSASATGGTQGSYRIERLLRGEGAPCA